MTCLTGDTDFFIIIFSVLGLSYFRSDETNINILSDEERVDTSQLEHCNTTEDGSAGVMCGKACRRSNKVNCYITYPKCSHILISKEVQVSPIYIAFQK